MADDESLPDKAIRKAREAGAKTTADIGVFLVCAGATGLLDAFSNPFAFADAIVVAPLGGAVGLGIKKLLIDAPIEYFRKSKDNDT